MTQSTAPPSIKVFSIPELLSEITQHLDYLDVMNCLQVNKDWHQAWHSHWMTLFNHLLLDFDKRRSFFQTVPTMESYVKNSAHYPHACGPRHPTLSALLDHAQGQNGQAKEMVIVWNPKELPKGYNVTSASDLPETNTEGNIHVFLRNNSRTTLPKAIQFLGQVKCLALRLGILWDNGSALEDICTLLRSIPMTTEKLCLQPNQYRGWGQRSAPRAVELTTLAYQTLLARGSNETTAPSPDSALSTIATADGVAGPGEIADIEVNHQLQALSGLSLDPTPTTLPVGPSLFPALTTLDISNCLTLSSQTAAITELLPNCPLLYDITFPSLGNGISAVAALALQQRHPPIGKILMGEPERPQASAGAINLLNACGATLRKLKMTLKAKPYQEKSLVASIIRHWQLVDLTLVEWGHSNESLVQILSLLPNLRHFSLETVVKNLAWGRRQRQLLPASHKSRFLDIYAVPLFEDKPLFASERLESLNLSLGCSWDETLADDYDHLKYVRNACKQLGRLKNLRQLTLSYPESCDRQDMQSFDMSLHSGLEYMNGLENLTRVDLVAIDVLGMEMEEMEWIKEHWSRLKFFTAGWYQSQTDGASLVYHTYQFLMPDYGFWLADNMRDCHVYWSRKDEY